MKKTTLAVLAILFVALSFLAGCRERIVWTGPGDWLLLAEDPDDGNVAYNAHYLYVDADFSDSVLMFKVVTYDTIPNAADSVLLAVYFDADQNVTTGLSPTTPGWAADAKPQSIGADYMMLVGSEVDTLGNKLNTNLIFSWNGTGNRWDTTTSTALNPYIPANRTDSVIGGISETTLGNPSAVDIEVIFICALADTVTPEYRDRVPNSGHVTIDLANDSIIPASSAISGGIASSSKSSGVSLVTGKPREIQEVR